jgi:hypothetical protein
MSTSKSSVKRRGGKRGSRAVKTIIDHDSAYLALPADELRQLVLRITTRHHVHPFVGWMVKLLDSLKDGRTGALARIARQSDDRAFAELMAAMARAVKRGDVAAAHETAFFAASYAYQNSLEYLIDLFDFLDEFRAPRV